MAAIEFTQGGYRYVPGVFQYSGGVAALPGFAIERVRFHQPVPLAQGFQRIEAMITAAGRPLTAFCACELRSPAPFTEDGFRAFNELYVGTLSRWGIFDGKVNPVARSNVCPELDKPAEPSFHAFCFTARAPDAAPSFAIAGSGEAPEDGSSYAASTVRHGETGADAMADKARFVLGEMERRMGLLGFRWADTTAAQVYTVHDLYPFLAGEIARRGAARAGLTWHYCRPPVVGLEYEMDCRGLAIERVI
ncbi:MAG: hypothetical protein FJX52_04645 [Alphaproteobacteria bacterium]|nr:hypothetical protein [Alphaproteobacteria bacterium]